MPISELHQHHTTRIEQSFLIDYRNMAKSLTARPSRARQEDIAGMEMLGTYLQAVPGPPHLRGMRTENKEEP